VQKKAQKKMTSSVVVMVTNLRSVALSELDAIPSGGTLPNTIVSNLAPGKTISVTVATVKSCVFNLHGAYADGSSTDSTSLDLCKDKNVNLVE
jgi:archaellum component FlaF (FlaF/FlaG flagellin family)